jgi:hypothetical protein
VTKTNHFFILSSFGATELQQPVLFRTLLIGVPAKRWILPRVKRGILNRKGEKINYIRTDNWLLNHKGIKKSMLKGSKLSQFTLFDKNLPVAMLYFYRPASTICPSSCRNFICGCI